MGESDGQFGQGATTKSSPINLAVERHRDGDLAEARRLYEEVISADPTHGRAHYLLGVLHDQENRSQEARACLEKAVHLSPLDHEAWFKFGRLAYKFKDYSTARQAFSEAVILKPNTAEFYNALGNVEYESGRKNIATRFYEFAHSLDHQNKGVVCNLANVYREDGKYLVARELLEKLTNEDPNFKYAWNILGLLDKDLGNYSESASHFQRAIELDPDFENALNNMGMTCRILGESKDAEKYFREAIRCSPKISSAIINLCSLLCEQKRYSEASELLRGAPQELRSDISLITTACMVYSYLCNWTPLRHEVTMLHRKMDNGEVINSPFYLLSASDSAALQLRETKKYMEREYGAVHRNASHKPNKTCTTGKLRIAYFSSDFQAHPIAQLLVGLIENHNKDKFELFGFSNGAASIDPFKIRFQHAFSEFIHIKTLSDNDVYSEVKRRNIDIAIDVNGLTVGSRTRVFAMRCAPIQINFLGYPGSMGAPYYDYIIADNVLIPPDFENFYSEKIIRVSQCYQPNDDSRGTPVCDMPRDFYGLPRSGFVYCCFNNSYKISEIIFRVWMEILLEVGDSVLWLLEETEVTSRNIKHQARLLGVDPGRIIFAKRTSLEGYLARQKHADLFLDTFPYSAHTTASDALWMGIPILTLQGKSFASRVCSSLLLACDLPELITTTLADYKAKAIELGSRRETLQSATEKARLAKYKAKLFDILSYVQSFEENLFRVFYEECQVNQGSPLGEAR